MKNITPEDFKSKLRKTVKTRFVVPPPKEFLEEARKTISRPSVESKKGISSFMLKKWAEQREADDLVDIQQDIMNVNNWQAGVANDFLDTWWSTSPGSYNYYHKEYKGKGTLMISELRERSEGTFNFIWECMVENLIEELEPERPGFKK